MADNNQNLGRQQGGQQGQQGGQQGGQQRGNQSLPDENRKNVGLGSEEEDTDLEQGQEFNRGGQQGGQQSGRSGQQSDQNLGNKKGNI
jgi:hypothetical protein